MALNRPLPSSIAATKVVTGSAPGAAAEITQTVPAGKWWDVLAVRLSLTTSATAGNRRPELVIDDGATTYWSWRAGVDQGVSLTRSYQFLRSLSNEVDRSATFNEMFEPLDEDMLLPSGHRIRTSSSLQAADQWAAPVFYVVEYG
jgi:hypothetical protein